MTQLRPSHLPDFDKPPLNEMIVGVQFAPPPTYRSIDAHDVWELFRQVYPGVQEQPPLAPSFETFGTPFGPQISFNFIGVGGHPRYLFTSIDQAELLQFQPDRFLHNWRRVPGKNNLYPRFELIIEKFENELNILERRLASYGKKQLDINQCEITYVNHIYSSVTESEPNPSDWLTFLRFVEAPADVNMIFRRTLLGPEGRAFGRLIVETSSAVGVEQRKLINFTLTVRGAPRGTRIEDAISFLRHGRETIVTSFATLTTEKAHSDWEMVI
ncbi:MAG: TIGR04255 family protein [Rhodomicrobium sp.]